MEKDVRIIDAETILRDGILYLHYVVECNGKIEDMEIPYYDENGQLSEDAIAIMEAAKKHKEESKKVATDLVVYQEPEKNAKLDRNYSYKHVIAAGLAGILIGAAITGGFMSCDHDTNKKTDNKAKEPALEKEYKEEELKIVYITEEDYYNGVKILCEHLNNNLGFNYKPVDLNAFYYCANMDQIPNDVFSKLVTDGYLPDTDVGIVQSAFEITSDLRTKFVQTGKMNIDFNKLFIDTEVAAISEDYKKDFECIPTSTDEQMKDIITKLEGYMFDNPEKGYNLLPVGGEFIFNHVIANAIDISIGTNTSSEEIKTSQAFEEEIHDITAIVKALGDNFNCMVVTETEKQLTK